MTPPTTADLLDQLDRLLQTLSRGVALGAVFGMVLISIFTVIDVALRSWANSPIPGFYELTQLVMAIVIACCFPAVLAMRRNLTVDFLQGMMSPRLQRLAAALGAITMLVFVTVLAWRFVVFTQGIASRNAETIQLLLPVAPFWWVVTAVLIFSILVQVVATLQSVKYAILGPASPDPEKPTKRRPVVLGLVITLTLLATFATLALAFPAEEGSFLQEAGLREAANVSILAFVAMVSLLMLQIPLASAMGLVGLAAASAMLDGYSGGLNILSTNAADLLKNMDLAAIPLFILMGGFASAAGVSADIYRLANALLGRFKGGLALATIGACAGFGAVTGSSVATAATMGRVSLPEMRQRGYADTLATGTIAAGGTLGMLIPPSAIMVIYAVLADTSISQMFIAAIIPAAIAVFFYMAVVVATVLIKPHSAPAGRQASGREVLDAIVGSWSVVVLFGIVVGGIYGGLFTATEAAAVGAGGAFVFFLVRKGLDWKAFWQVLEETASSAGMIYLIVVGSMVFAFFVGIAQLPNGIVESVQAANLAPLLVVALILLLYVFLGAFMDPITMLLITVPVVLPLIQNFGFDLIWWGILTVMVIEIGMISPPLGLNVFVIKSVADDMELSTVFRGIVPFLLADLLRLAVIVALPILATWLPSTMRQ
jgi:C4-dicarboxylate transporter DctM subunit